MGLGIPPLYIKIVLGSMHAALSLPRERREREVHTPNLPTNIIPTNIA